MKESVRIVRFAIIGTLNALITASVVALMMHIYDEHYILANVVAYIVAQIHNFIWCKYWIFPLEKARQKHTVWRQMALFLLAFAVAYALQFLFLLTLVELLDCNEYLAQFLGLFIYGGINFLANRFLTFR